MHPNNRLLAVDLQTHCAVALFSAEGRLLAVGSEAARGDDALRGAARQVLCAGDSLGWLVSAGAPACQATWERVAMRQGVRVQRVGQPDWQRDLLGEAAEGAARDAAALALAQSIAQRDGLAEASQLSLEEARAICIGLWASQRAALGLSVPSLRAISGVVAVGRAKQAAGPKAGRLARVA